METCPDMQMMPSSSPWPSALSSASSWRAKQGRSLFSFSSHRPKSPSAKWFSSLHIWHRMSNTSTGLLKDCTAGIVALLKALSIFIQGIKNCHCVVLCCVVFERDQNRTFCSHTLSACLGIKGNCIKRDAPNTRWWSMLGIFVWSQDISTPKSGCLCQDVQTQPHMMSRTHFQSDVVYFCLRLSS